MTTVDATAWRAILLAAILLGQGNPALPVQWGDLEPGAVAVGFRSVRHEHAGVATAEAAAIRIDLWYPARVSATSRLTFGHYAAHETGEGTDPAALRSWLAGAVSGDPAGVSAATLDEILADTMYAHRDAELVAGDHPLVLWTARHETTPAQAVLSEFLASHGYVVASVRREGARLPYPWEMETPAQREATFAAHLADLELALEALAATPDVDAGRTAVLTWSYGAELAPVLQARNPSIAMVIGLSSNPLATAGVYFGEGTAAGLRVEELRATYVVMTEPAAPDGTPRLPPPVLQELPVESYFVVFRDLTHGNFNALEGMIPGVYGLTDVHSWSRGGAAARDGYATIARYVLAFLDERLRNEPAATSRPAPWDRESPSGSVRTTRYGG